VNRATYADAAQCLAQRARAAISIGAHGHIIRAVQADLVDPHRFTNSTWHDKAEGLDG